MINKNWDVILKDEMSKDYFKKLGVFIKNEYRTKRCFPPYENIFDALRFTDYDEVKVVVLGQDPYHGLGEAHGLSFSVKEGVRKPPSLQNIFKELENDLGIKREASDLTDWAKQGVLLLNSIMTVVEDRPLSHKDKGWENFTDAIIKAYYIIESVHPSPLSANRCFFGSNTFSKINNILENNHQDKINW